MAAILAPDHAAPARETTDAGGRHLFPGRIDPHTHLGYTRPFADDVRSETAPAALGGVTTVLTFHRYYGGAQPAARRRSWRRPVSSGRRRYCWTSRGTSPRRTKAR